MNFEQKGADVGKQVDPSIMAYWGAELLSGSSINGFQVGPWHPSNAAHYPPPSLSPRMQAAHQDKGARPTRHDSNNLQEHG